MSTRKEILERALFDTGGEVEGIQFGSLSAPRFQILRRRGNSFANGTNTQEEAIAIAEVLFVLSRTSEQRQAMFRFTDEQWQDALMEFFEALPDKAIERFFTEYLNPAMEALVMAQTESEGPGKSSASPSRATSHSSTKGQRSSGSTTSRKRSTSKARQSGKSASPQSSNSSSRTRSGKGTGTGGSTGHHRRKKS